MVTQQELRQRGRAEQVRARVESERIRQQEELIKKQELERQKEIEKARKSQDFIEYKGGRYSREDYEKAMRAIERKSSGKRIAFGSNEGVAKRLYIKLAKEPEIAKALEKGMLLRGQMREAEIEGGIPIQVAISKKLGKEIFIPIESKKLEPEISQVKEKITPSEFVEKFGTQMTTRQKELVSALEGKPISTQPIIKEIPTGEYVKDAPVTKLEVYDPVTKKTRKVTKEEERYFEEQQAILRVGEGRDTFVSKFGRRLEEGEVTRFLFKPEKFGERVEEIISPEVKGFFAPEFEKEMVTIVNPVLASAVPATKAPKFFKVPLRKVREPQFIEIQRPLIMDGKQKTISFFKIKAEVKPPTLVEPVMIDQPAFIRPAKVEVTKPLRPIVGEEPFVTLTTRGGKGGRLEVISGVSERVSSLKELKSLPKRQQFLWKRLAEQVTGRPVKLENVPKVLKKEALKGRGVIEQFRLGKVDISKRVKRLELLEPRFLGRRIKRAEVVSQFERVKKGKELDIFKGQLTFKDVTKPLARAIGDTPLMKGKIIRIKEPIVIGEGLGVKTLRPSLPKVKRTPFARTFQEQVKPTVILPVPKQPTPKPISLKPVDVMKKNGKLGLLSGVSARVSPRPDSSIVSDFARGFEVGGITGKITAEETRKLVGEKEVELLKEEQLRKLATQQKQLFKELEVEQVKSLQLPTQKLVQEPILKQKPLQILGVKQRLETIQKQKPLLVKPFLVGAKIKRPVRPTRPKPTPPPILSPPLSSLAQRLAKKVEKEPEAFEIFARKAGKDIKVGKAKTEQEAFKLLKEKLKGTLRASGFVKKGGKKVRPPILLNGEFRKSKEDPLRVVQKKTKRLGTFGETKEIQFFRKGKKPRKKGKGNVFRR